MPISNVYTNPLDESNVLLKRSTLSPSSFQAQSAPVSHLLFFFIDPGAEPQVLPSANRVDLSSQLSTAPAGTVGLSRHKRPTSRPRLPTLLAVSLFRFFFFFFFYPTGQWPRDGRKDMSNPMGRTICRWHDEFPYYSARLCPSVSRPGKGEYLSSNSLALSFFLFRVWTSGSSGVAHTSPAPRALCALLDGPTIYFHKTRQDARRSTSINRSIAVFSTCRWP